MQNQELLHQDVPWYELMRRVERFFILHGIFHKKGCIALHFNDHQQCSCGVASEMYSYRIKYLEKDIQEFKQQQSTAPAPKVKLANHGNLRVVNP